MSISTRPYIGVDSTECGNQHKRIIQGSTSSAPLPSIDPGKLMHEIISCIGAQESKGCERWVSNNLGCHSFITSCA